MLLTFNELNNLIDDGIIQGAKREHVNAASIDVVLGNMIWVEAPIPGGCTIVDLAAKETPNMLQHNLDIHGHYDLRSQHFCLAQTKEIFNLPNNIAAEFRLKSSAARAGLNASLAMWCDPGWNGSTLTLELSNVMQYHDLRLRSGMKIGQMIFYSGTKVPKHASYATKGQYNGDTSATPSKGIR